MQRPGIIRVFLLLGAWQYGKEWFQVSIVTKQFFCTFFCRTMRIRFNRWILF
eukprot:403376629